MKRSAYTLRMVAVLTFAIMAGGCYHAVIETGRQPSGTRVEDKWADSFLEGLVSPDVVETAERCPDGVARVETRRSFLNVLVGALTWGIYTPMEIIAHCAAAGEAEASDSTVRVSPVADEAELAAAITRAASLSVHTDAPVFVARVE